VDLGKPGTKRTTDTVGFPSDLINEVSKVHTTHDGRIHTRMNAIPARLERIRLEAAATEREPLSFTMESDQPHK
jgi:hypothetical protein